jgi:hypothetical protein
LADLWANQGKGLRAFFCRAKQIKADLERDRQVQGIFDKVFVLMEQAAIPCALSGIYRKLAGSALNPLQFALST